MSFTSSLTMFALRVRYRVTRRFEKNPSPPAPIQSAMPPSLAPSFKSLTTSAAGVHRERRGARSFLDDDAHARPDAGFEDRRMTRTSPGTPSAFAKTGSLDGRVLSGVIAPHLIAGATVAPAEVDVFEPVGLWRHPKGHADESAIVRHRVHGPLRPATSSAIVPSLETSGR